MKRLSSYVMVAMSVSPALYEPSYAYEIHTHDLISGIAGEQSTAGGVLQDSFGLSPGLDSLVGGQSLALWLRQGALREDNQLRFLNHFHNPLADSWTGAGLLGSVGQSAVLWAQNREQGFPGWSWSDVRELYFDAMTKATRTDRDRALAGTFEGLGHQIHLVQDAASPAHARNDGWMLRGCAAGSERDFQGGGLRNLFFRARRQK